jgi:hypothetical protein
MLFGATAVALAASLVLMILFKRERDELRGNAVAASTAKDQQIDSLRARLKERDDFLASLTGPSVQVVGLAATQSKNPRAFMFWNQASDRWTLIAHNLAPLRAGRTYQLWLVTDSAKISAGTFSVTPTGEAVVQATYALAKDALKAVAVTEEPAGGVPQPTGSIVIVGSAGKP